MDWAHDQLGHVVHASGKGLFSYGLKRPTCAEPVFRRAGGHRRPHFAHYSFAAKPGCELYRPAVPANAQLSYVSAQRSDIRFLGFRGGLFLGHRAGGGFQLYLRLPKLESATNITGQIEIQSGLGIRLLTAGNLLSKQFVPLTPAVPLVEVSGFGNLSAVAESIRQDVTEFREADNFFRSVEDGGRVLSVLEPLELGQRYCVLGRQALPLPPPDIGIRITDQSVIRDWHLCGVELPRGHPGSERELVNAIARSLGRMVRLSSVRIWPIDPPPHHIEADGTLVYPTGTQKISVRRNGPCEVLISSSGQADDLPRVSWLDDEWGEIDGIGGGELSLFQGDQEQFCIRVEPCEQFAPVGIQVETDHGGWDMFDPRASCVELNDAMQIRLVCPNERVALSVPIDPNVWERSGTTLTLLGAEGLQRVDAGGFGTLQGRELSKILVVPPIVDPKHVWIEGVMTRLGGPTMLNILPWRTPLDGGGPFQLSTSEELSWLGTHVRAAKGG